MIHREQGKKWKLPDQVQANESSVMPRYHSYKVLGFRPPKRGEWYLSGATISAWQALADLSSEYLVIELLDELVPRTKTVWVPKGETS